MRLYVKNGVLRELRIEVEAERWLTLNGRLLWVLCWGGDFLRQRDVCEKNNSKLQCFIEITSTRSVFFLWYLIADEEPLEVSIFYIHK